MSLLFANGHATARELVSVRNDVGTAGRSEGSRIETEGKRVEAISPCGVCRQVMMETVKRQGKPFEVILCGTDDAIVISDCRLLLPFAFDGSDIPS